MIQYMFFLCLSLIFYFSAIAQTGALTLTSIFFPFFASCSLGRSFFFLPSLYYLIRISDRTPEEDGNSWADNCSSSRLPRRCSLFLLLPLPRPEDSEITLVKKTFGVKT